MLWGWHRSQLLCSPVHSTTQQYCLVKGRPDAFRPGHDGDDASFRPNIFWFDPETRKNRILIKKNANCPSEQTQTFPSHLVTGTLRGGFRRATILTLAAGPRRHLGTLVSFVHRHHLREKACGRVLSCISLCKDTVRELLSRKLIRAPEKANVRSFARPLGRCDLTGLSRLARYDGYSRLSVKLKPKQWEEYQRAEVVRVACG